MHPAGPLHLSGTRFAVEYHLSGTEAQARAKAELLCLDQTVEAPDEIIPPGVIREQILGRIERFGRLNSGASEALISFPVELLSGDCGQLLNVMFGLSSLKPGVRVARLHLPDSALRLWPGPRFGRTGLREWVGVPGRPLVCGVLKPLGLSPGALADLAFQFALGGLDLVKDDQGLANQPFCPFEERVARCAEAVAGANRETGRACRYVPHVSGSWDDMRQRSLFAKQAGAGGLMVCPGLTGFDALRELAREVSIALPILSHRACSGASSCMRKAASRRLSYLASSPAWPAPTPASTPALAWSFR